MAETSETEHPPQTNGLPEENEEDDKSKMRPADIDADMREMERRKRVEMIMSSRLFREELERIIESQMKEGGGPAGLLQQIQDMVGGAGRLHAGAMFKNSNCVVPINDIRGVESMGYAKGEKILRCKLASVFRLMDLYGWTHGINNNITARLNQEEEHFLVNPYGMMFHEVTASSLVKVDMQGNIVESGTTNFGVNAAGFQLHAAVHSARPDIKCIIHIHTPSVLAVSSLKCGLLPVCQESAVIGEISQHPYLGPISEPEEKDKIARNLGPINKVMFLTNYGAVCCGETVEEAFFNVYNTVLACETQVKLMPLGVDNLLLLSEESRKQMYDSARKAPEGVAVQPASGQLPQTIEKKEKRWRIGGMEFEALMRMLDNAGFRTGYIYRTPLVKGEPPRPRNDVEVPPAVSSLGYLLEEEEMYKQGNWKKGFYNKNDRTRWLNSPNVYQKVEILETGTPDPKKITKWVADGSPTHTSTPVKIDAALQFVPKNTNPKEFKKLQQQIKENRRADKITSGPQSHILDEGVAWDEAKKLQDANISMTGDQVIMVGTASKGIIQRGFQHNATVYKTPYAKNPFDYVSDQELEDYKKVVIRKQKGEYYDEDQSESEPLSSSAALPPSGAIKSPPSETEDDSRTEPRVLRIETKTAPLPSQAEVVLSDVDDLDDYPSPHVERSKSQRYPQNRVTEREDTKRSASLERPKTKPVVKDEVGILVKARIVSLEQLYKEKSAYPRKLHKYVPTCSKSSQTKLRIYIEDNSEDCINTVTTVDNAAHIPKPSQNIVPDIIKATTHPKISPNKHDLEMARMKSIMNDIQRELSFKLKTNSVFKKRQSFGSAKQEYTSCTVYPLPCKTSSAPIEIVSASGFTSDDSADTSPDSAQDKTVINRDDDVSIESYVGDDYQEGESMSSMDLLLPSSPAKSALIFNKYNHNRDNFSVASDKKKTAVDSASTINSYNNQTVQKQFGPKFNVDISEIKLLINDLVENVATKFESSLQNSTLSCSSPTSHSSPIAEHYPDSGYDADTDRTVIHNGTALFSHFNLDYSISDLNEPTPVPARRKLNSVEEFQVLEGALEYVSAVDSQRREPTTSRAFSPLLENSSFIHYKSNSELQDGNDSIENEEFEENNNSTSLHFCKPPELIYLQNSMNQILAFKRVEIRPKILKKSDKSLIVGEQEPNTNRESKNNDTTSQKEFTAECENKRELDYNKLNAPLSNDSDISSKKSVNLSVNAKSYTPLSTSNEFSSSPIDQNFVTNPSLHYNKNTDQQNIYDDRLSPTAKSYEPSSDSVKSDCYIMDKLDDERLSPSAKSFIPSSDSKRIHDYDHEVHRSEIPSANVGTSDSVITDNQDVYDTRLSANAESYEPFTSAKQLENSTSDSVNNPGTPSFLLVPFHYNVHSPSNLCHEQLTFDNSCDMKFNSEFIQNNSECSNELYQNNLIEGGNHDECFTINNNVVCPCLNNRCRDNLAIHPPDLIDYRVEGGEVFLNPQYRPDVCLAYNINTSNEHFAAIAERQISQESMFNWEKTEFFSNNYTAYDEDCLIENEYPYFPNNILLMNISTQCEPEESLMHNYHIPVGNQYESFSGVPTPEHYHFSYPENEVIYDYEEFYTIPTCQIYRTGYIDQLHDECNERMEQTDGKEDVEEKGVDVDDEEEVTEDEYDDEEDEEEEEEEDGEEEEEEEEVVEEEETIEEEEVTEEEEKEETIEDEAEDYDCLSTRVFYPTEFNKDLRVLESKEDNHSCSESEESASKTVDTAQGGKLPLETKTMIEFENLTFCPQTNTHEFPPLNNFKASFNRSQVQSVINYNNNNNNNIASQQTDVAELPITEYTYTVDYDVEFAYCFNPGSYVEHEAVTSFNSNNFLYTIYENSEVNQY